MTDKTKSTVKDDASKDTSKAKESTATEQVNADTTSDDKAAQPPKGGLEETSIEKGNDTIDAGTGENTIPEAEGTEGETAAATLDTVKIKQLIDQIENAGGQSPLDLANRLMQEEGLKPVDCDDDRKMISMAGVRCRATDRPDPTLQNWCNAARRALLKAA